ncbi:MAG: 4-(cytidine 5'-diphospho)-2-C-methyl-D-erythritol kinase [Lentisphaeria bacterium]|nr:4-(cytidine 5'-diphospho)-2-C-methyl-D-erythritol kinase [Lentisphaeria bacterium]
MIVCSKINLLLNVLNRRSDGYHELDTIFFPLQNPADELTIDFNGDTTGSVTIQCDTPGVPLDPASNLCGKAVYAYCKAAEIPVPACTIHLEKHIPCAGGMGGGSSDCAAVLQLLQEKFALLTDVQLAETALSLGADVPFFLHCKPARAGGVGEKLSILENIPEDLPILLAASDFPISAKWAYQQWTPSYAFPADQSEKLIMALQKKDLQTAAHYIGNSLAFAAFRKFPLLQIIKDEFYRSGALCAELSGSGPTVFGLYSSMDTLEQAKQYMTKHLPGVRIIGGRKQK